MKNYLYKGIVILFISAFFFSCMERKNARQVFEENKEKFIDACAPIFIEKGADSIDARNFCGCIMETLFEIDSTFFIKDLATHKTEMNDKINQHMPELKEKCYPLLEIDLSDEKVN